MRKYYLLLFLLTLSASFVFAQKKEVNTRKEVFTYCDSESGNCVQKCTVQLISGSKITTGSYVKVYLKTYYETLMIGEGYILKHKSGRIFILKDKKDVKNEEINGGCADDTLEVDLVRKRIWGC
jgi:hypothetical protein